jgi:hypothetical protein
MERRHVGQASQKFVNCSSTMSNSHLRGRSSVFGLEGFDAFSPIPTAGSASHRRLGWLCNVLGHKSAREDRCAEISRSD